MLITAFVFIIILSILVFIHELGHFFVALWIGVAVEEFGFGLPPRIFGKKIGNTIYSLNWLPIGGFVKLAGEDEEDQQTEKGPSTSLRTSKGQKVDHYFWARSKKERTAILCAGVLMNFILAVGITAFLLHDGVKEPSGRVHVENVDPGSPAQLAGLIPQDIIVSARVSMSTDIPLMITVTRELIYFSNVNAGQRITLEILRNGQQSEVAIIPRKDPPAGQGPMGVVITDLELHTYSWFQAPVKALEVNFSRAREMLSSLGMLVFRLVTLKPFSADVAGPIGIAQVTGEAVKFGFRAVLEFVSILSLNLAVLNILPFPALDGGRLLFVFLEKLIGKRVKPAFERSIHQVGMIILFVLILLVSINDIMRLARGG